MHRFYKARRELLVEPTTGAIVFGKQAVHQYYGRTADDPSAVTIVEMSPELDAATVDEQVQRAVESKRLIDWAEIYGPLTAGGLGLVCLVSGVVVIFRHSRTSDRSAAESDNPQSLADAYS